MLFEKLGLIPSLVKATKALNFTAPTPVQTEVIPEFLVGKDVMGIAPTGSGKTASYALPILQQLQTKQRKNRNVDVLILVPTRELAEQVKEVFHDFSQHVKVPVKTMAVYGGVSINPQMKGLFGINVLIATPGRLLDLHDKNALKLNAINTLVIDEADKMLHLGFKEEMDAIFKLLPAMRQNALFSATLNKNVEEVTALVLRNPSVVSVAAAEDQEEAEIEQRALRVTNETKGPMLRYLIKHYEMDQVLVFVESSFKADNVVKKLKKNGILAAAIHGKKSQGSRTDSLVKFKNKNINVLVATDLLARGIDIEALPTVINYDLPRSPKDYVHRIGRTGRAGKSGLAFSLITPESQAHFKVIQKKMGKWVTLESTTDINLQGY